MTQWWKFYEDHRGQGRHKSGKKSGCILGPAVLAVAVVLAVVVHAL